MFSNSVLNHNLKKKPELGFISMMENTTKINHGIYGCIGPQCYNYDCKKVCRARKVPSRQETYRV